jgi:hypothetical protein
MVFVPSPPRVRERLAGVDAQRRIREGLARGQRGDVALGAAGKGANLWGNGDLSPVSDRSQLAMQAQQKAKKKEQSEPVNYAGVEDKYVELLPEVILFRTEKHVPRF